MNTTNSTQDETSQTQTSKTVLETIEQDLEETDKVELSDTQLTILGLSDDKNTSRVPTISTHRKVDPVKWALYDVSRIQGRDSGEFLAIERHTKQQGPKHTRYYAIGLGEISFTDIGTPSFEHLKQILTKKAIERDVEMISDKLLHDIQIELKKSAREFANIAVTESVWAAAYDGSNLWIEPETSRWEGINNIINDSEITEDQKRLLKEYGITPSQPNYLETTTSFGFVVAVDLE